MKPRKSSNQNEHDTAVMDCASEFDDVIANDFDLIDMDAWADVNDDDDDLY